MNISELIEKLEAVKEEHGDLRVQLYQQGSYYDSSEVELVKNWNRDVVSVEIT